jgi:transcriptional regulator with XRE-family HTH domain
MDLANLDRLLGIDVAADPVAFRARRLVEADAGLLDDLIALRKRKDLIQDDLADRMGVSQSAIARIESGDRDPRLSTLRRYALALGAMVTHEVVDDEGARVKTPEGTIGIHGNVDWPAPELRVRDQDREEVTA